MLCILSNVLQTDVPDLQSRNRTNKTAGGIKEMLENGKSKSPT